MCWLPFRVSALSTVALELQTNDDVLELFLYLAHQKAPRSLASPPINSCQNLPLHTLQLVKSQWACREFPRRTSYSLCVCPCMCACVRVCLTFHPSPSAGCSLWTTSIHSATCPADGTPALLEAHQWKRKLKRDEEIYPATKWQTLGCPRPPVGTGIWNRWHVC